MFQERFLFFGSISHGPQIIKPGGVFGALFSNFFHSFFPLNFALCHSFLDFFAITSGDHVNGSFNLKPFIHKLLDESENIWMGILKQSFQGSVPTLGRVCSSGLL